MMTGFGADVKSETANSELARKKRADEERRKSRESIASRLQVKLIEGGGAETCVAVSLRRHEVQGIIDALLDT